LQITVPSWSNGIKGKAGRGGDLEPEGPSGRETQEGISTNKISQKLGRGVNGLLAVKVWKGKERKTITAS